MIKSNVPNINTEIEVRMYNKKDFLEIFPELLTKASRHKMNNGNQYEYNTEDGFFYSKKKSVPIKFHILNAYDLYKTSEGDLTQTINTAISKLQDAERMFAQIDYKRIYMIALKDSDFIEMYGNIEDYIVRIFDNIVIFPAQIETEEYDTDYTNNANNTDGIESIENFDNIYNYDAEDKDDNTESNENFQKSDKLAEPAGYVSVSPIEKNVTDIYSIPENVIIDLAKSNSQRNMLLSNFYIENDDASPSREELLYRNRNNMKDFTLKQPEAIVVSNGNGFGGAYVFDVNILESIAERLVSDCIVYPYSEHESIVVAAKSDINKNIDKLISELADSYIKRIGMDYAPLTDKCYFYERGSLKIQSIEELVNS